MIKKIYLVHYREEWAEGDPDHKTYAYVDPNRAKSKVASLIKYVQEWNGANEFEITSA